MYREKERKTKRNEPIADWVNDDVSLEEQPNDGQRAGRVAQINTSAEFFDHTIAHDEVEQICQSIKPSENKTKRYEHRKPAFVFMPTTC